MANNRKYFVNLYGNQPASHGSLGIPQSLWPPVEIAQRDPAVADALRLLGTQGFARVNLYRILEIVCEDVEGIENIQREGWASGNELTRFKRTIDHSETSGDEARHGYSKGQPPPNPMSSSELGSFLNSIFSNWLTSKEDKQRPSR